MEDEINTDTYETTGIIKAVYRKIDGMSADLLELIRRLPDPTTRHTVQGTLSLHAVLAEMLKDDLCEIEAHEDHEAGTFMDTSGDCDLANGPSDHILH